MVMNVENTPPERPRFVRLDPEEMAANLGPLARLPGTWVGDRGWNLIAVPEKGRADGFTLLLRPYYETITFTPLGVLVPDRGIAGTMAIFGLEYTLRVSDTLTHQPLHLENGMWLYLNDPQNPTPHNIVRHATVPHGNSVLALGNSEQSDGPPVIPPVDTLPIGRPAGRDAGYIDPYIGLLPPELQAIKPPFKTRDANSVLRDAIKNQTILNTVRLDVSTQTASGGIVNIPFIQQNANATSFDATFWLETVQHEDKETGGPYQYDQLQYSQRTILDFVERGDGPGLIQWPHVNVNTLVRQ